ncbi:uncharacterized protein LOC110988584 isoform X2 [Acanthaster planci]|uniref:Coactosin-like protein n=1 Tax=Acanthaster planci TaxID=133434 RepID=A0A8B7ZSC1_ACAPL|nr:uncharacterized protein LOC110988584 isoform X2 [Acanthaster planci]
MTPSYDKSHDIKGSDVSQMHEFLKDDQVMYVLARLDTTYDMSTTVKFVYVHWIGVDVPLIKKARFGVVHESVCKHLQPCHLTLETDSTTDITKETMLQKLEETAGTISKVMEMSDIEGRQERGFTQTQSQNSSKIPGKSSTATRIAEVSREGASVTFSPEVSDAIDDLRSDNSPTNWLVAGYEGGNPKSQIVVVKSGNDGLAGMKELLEDNSVFYGLLRVSNEIDDISTIKFVYITWVGSKVKPMTKAKVATHKGVCGEMFQPAHIEVFASELADLLETDIMNKVMAASGTKLNVRT